MKTPSPGQLVAADAELAVLTDGPGADAWYWRADLEAQQAAARQVHARGGTRVLGDKARCRPTDTWLDHPAPRTRRAVCAAAAGPTTPTPTGRTDVMADGRELLDAIQECVPYDGPHSADTVADAARGLSVLVRYLNNATGPGNGRTTLESATTVYRVLGGLGAAAGGLDQLFKQLAGGMDRQATDPTLYDDRRDRPGADTAHALAALLSELRGTAGGLAWSLDQARELSAHLGHD